MEDVSRLLKALARRTSLEGVTFESAPAHFVSTNGERTTGVAEATVSRSSISIRFAPDVPLAIKRARYGEVNGHITAFEWKASRVNFVGMSSDNELLFVTQELAVDRGEAEAVAATRIVYAGADWEGEAVVGGVRVVAMGLSKDGANHHDERLSIAIEGQPDERTIQNVTRAASIVAGLDVEPLRVDAFSGQGEWIRTRHVRGARRVGRGPHSPFTGLPDEARMEAWSRLFTAIPGLEAEGVPVVPVINLIASSNQVSEIDPGAVLLLLATQTMANFDATGPGVGPGAASHLPQLAGLNSRLALGLTDEDLDRFETLRLELLDTGFFQKPGYESGRPQNDIKFLRDLAHLIVFRLCGYTGPFYSSETFSTRSAALPAPSEARSAAAAG